MAGRLRHNRHRRPADTATTPCSGRAVFDDPQSPPCSPRTMRPAPPPSHTVPGTVDGAQGLSLTGGGGRDGLPGRGWTPICPRSGRRWTGSRQRRAPVDCPPPPLVIRTELNRLQCPHRTGDSVTGPDRNLSDLTGLETQ